ncbi:phage major capsid protein [Blastochloris viridis]|uniref:Phage major capsid protein \|nr:phage major capsid protein [Blastochloris viridis]ALK09497.1 Phage capsid family protein [Blastochloris viridis]BAS00618.1 phage major capsid protein \
MLQTSMDALRGSVALTLKGEADDPLAVVTKSLEELQKAVDERLKKVEEKDAKAADDKELKALQERLADLEKKANRPGAGSGNADERKEIERKALSHFLRTGSDVEVKAAATDSATDGGWMVLPTIDTSIRTLVTDLSPMRGLAEVVTISTDKYERFYSLGKRGAQWVVERDDRPQDTARPELIKASFGVAEMYAAPATTRTLLDDAAIDVASWLVNNATHDFAETEGEAFMTGTGANNTPRGLLDYDTDSAKDFTRAWGKFQFVPAGATAPTDAQFAAALIKLVSTLRRPYKANARFLMNGATAIRLRQIVDQNNRFLWAPTGNLIEGVDHPLLGYSVEIDDNMPDIGSGSLPIAFGDYKQGYVVVDRHGIRINRDELTQKGRIIFDVYKRVGGGAGDFNAIKFLKCSAS